MRHSYSETWIWRFLTVGLLAAMTLGSLPAPAADNVEPGKGYTLLGTIRPRDATQIESSNWSVGAETMDRDFTIYANWRKYLGPLGAKKARIQSGWAKTEKEKGHYDWAWMDEIIPDMVKQGVEPWVCLCYGNPIYPDGGGTGLGGGLPASDEALKAWDRYVGAFVDRYKQYVDEWEIWNEPRTGLGEGTARYAALVLRTAEVIRARQPNATIIFAAGGSFDTTYVEQVLTWLRDRGKLALVDEVAYHPYTPVPNWSYPKVAKLCEIIAAIAPKVRIRQGENGCPSTPGSFGALRTKDWTEPAQAKWALRRLMGDLGRDIPSSYFSICDMQYPDRKNTKGLLATNPDKTVRHAKPAYRAVQHMTALFDNHLKRIPDDGAAVVGGDSDRFSLFRYRADGGGQVLTLWRNCNIPDTKPDMERVVLSVPHGDFEAPVWIDLLSGRVYAMDASQWKRDGDTYVFLSVPVYDSVVVIADRRVVDPVLAADNVEPGKGYTLLGTIRPRDATQIESSNWSVGAETMDRDFTIYANWREYLGPLGVKKARVQSGWAKTEKEKGHYDWAWMDEIIPDMVKQGVEPWVCLCYGNPIYPEGGGARLGGGLPASDEALKAWDRYVGAFVDRYKKYVDEWEIWNEPRTHQGAGPVRYATFVLRTAEVIRARQPNATIIFDDGNSPDNAYIEQELTWIRSQGKLSLVNEVTYHPYTPVPSRSYAKVARLREVIAAIAPEVRIRQGESGCPSTSGSVGGLGTKDWTEPAQAKWALRRLMGDLGRDIPSSYFSICDMLYPNGMNTKGLLAANPDKTVRHAKPAYRAVQHMTALFDNHLKRIPDDGAAVVGGDSDRFSLFPYRADGGGQVLTLWRNCDIPDTKPDMERVVLSVPHGDFEAPVWIDLLSGRVYAMDASQCKRDGDTYVFLSVPVYDSVVVIADRRVVDPVLAAADKAKDKAK